MVNKNHLRKAIIPILVFSLSLFISCEKKPKKKYGLITLLRGNVTVNQKQTKLGTRIYKNDTIQTKKKSYAVIQFSKDALISIKANSQIQLNELAITSEGKPVTSFYQSSGSTYSKVLTKGSKYIIRTRYAHAAVRGTSFGVWVSPASKTTGLKVLKGSVEFSGKSKKDADFKEIIESEKKIKIMNSVLMKEQKLSSEELAALNEYDEIPVITPETFEKSLKENEKGIVIPDTLEEKMTIEGEIAPISKKPSKSARKPLTLDDLRKKYGALTRVTTKSGTTYIGKYSMQGEYSIIITTLGTVRISSKDIQSIKPY